MSAKNVRKVKPTADAETLKPVVKEVAPSNGHHANGHHANGNGHANGHANGHTKKTEVTSSKTKPTKPTKAVKPVAPVAPVKETVDDTVDTVAADDNADEIEITYDADSADDNASSTEQDLTETKQATPTKSKPKRARSETKRARSVSKPKAKSATRTTKSAGKGARKTKPKPKAKVSKSEEKSAKTDVVKPKRNLNNKPLSLDTYGVGIGTARVRNVLRYVALNPTEFMVRETLRAAGADGKSTFADLPDNVQQVVKEAEAAYRSSLREDYEEEFVKALKSNPDAYAKYEKARTAAKKAFDSSHQLSAEDKILNSLLPNRHVTEKFDVEAFNKSYNPYFYDGFDAFCAQKDNYQVGKEYVNKKNQTIKYSEWSRAAALVNKTTIRLSSHTHCIIACFLDRIVEQYAMNGIRNCLRQGCRTVSITHALSEGEEFNDTCYMRSFVESVPHHNKALAWVNQCAEIKAKHKQDRKEAREKESDETKEAETKNVETKEVEVKKPDLPAYPHPYDDKYSFASYVIDICRYVRKQLADKETNADRKELILTTNISGDFKAFCSNILYETIVCIGKNLKNLVDFCGVKTISDEMVYHTLKQLHTTCFMDYDRTTTSMTQYMSKYAVACEQLKQTRAQAAAAKAE